MISIIVNGGTILLGSILGLLIKNKLKHEITDAIMMGIGLFTFYLGITGLTSDCSSIVYLLATVLGGALGTALHLEDGVNRLADSLQQKFVKGDGASSRFAAGFAGFFIVSCVGAYTLVASFKAGQGDDSMIYTKAVMDLIVSMAMASSLGIGVLFSCVPVVLYESLLLLFSSVLSSVMSAPMMDAFSCMGAILTLAIGTNIAGITKIKIVNFVPALLFAPLLSALVQLF